MIFRRLVVVFFVGLGLTQAQSDLEPRPLPEIKGSIVLPKGWTVRTGTEDGVVIYHLGPENPEAGNVSLVLTMTPKVTERTEMKPSQYATEMLVATLDETEAKIEPTREGPIEILRASHLVESETGDVELLHLALANDTTGTLYFLTWHGPTGGGKPVEQLREAILSSLKVDPGF